MTCEDAQAHLPDHLARTLPVSVAAEVDAHVRTCDTCAADYAASEDTWHRLRAIPTVEPNTASMRTRFEAGLQAHIVERQPRQAMHRSFAYYGLQVAAAAVLVLLGVIIGRQAPPSPTSDSQLVALRNELRDMREMVAVSLLQQPSATERLKGVSWSNQIDQPGMSLTSALLDALTHDPSVNVRVSVIDALTRLAARDDIRRGALQALPRQTSPVVQMALIDFVVEQNGRDAGEALRRIADDPTANDTVRMRARQGLARLRIAI
jgi:hypothetical protein